MAETDYQNFADGYRTRAAQVVAPEGGYTAGQIVKLGNTYGVIAGAAAAGALATWVYESSCIGLPVTALASTTGWVPGAYVYYSASTGKIQLTSDNGALPCLGIVVGPGPAVGDTFVKCHLFGTMRLIGDEDREYVVTGSASLTEVKDGKSLAPAVAGVTYTVTGYRLVFAGNAAGADSINIQDTHTSPVVTVTVAAAAATDGAIVASGGLAIANVTVGAGLGGASTAAKGLVLKSVGASALTGTTSVKYIVSYKRAVA